MAINSRPADFRLEVGVEVGTSFQHMKEDITAIVRTLNKQPQKIKLSVDTDSLSKDFNKLKTDINELRKEAGEIKFSNQISTSLTNIQSSLSTLTESVSGVSGLKNELLALSEAMKSFQGISISLSSGKNPVQQMSQYGKAARALIADLKAQATDMERVLSRIYGGKGTGVLETAGRGLNVWEVAGTDSLSLQKALTDSSNLSKQMEAYALYIKLMKSVASYRKIDMTPILRLDELEKGYAAVEKLRTGEQQAETEAERLRGIFGSGINSEQLISKLDGIRLAIDKVVESLGTLTNKDIKIKFDDTSLQELREQIAKVVEDVSKLATVSKQSSGSSGGGSGGKPTTSGTNDIDRFKEAQKAIRDYYAALSLAKKGISDLHQAQDGTWAAEGHEEELRSLNRLRNVYAMYTSDKVKAQMTSKEQYKLLQLETDLSDRLATSTERRAVTDEASAQKRIAAEEEAAWKEYEARQAAEDKWWSQFESTQAKEEAAIASSTDRQIEEYYKAEAASEDAAYKEYEAKQAAEDKYWGQFEANLRKEEAATEASTQKQIAAYIKAENAREAAIDRENEKYAEAKAKEYSASEDAAYKEYEAKQAAEDKWWQEFENELAKEEEAVEAATKREIAAYEKLENARIKGQVESYWKVNGIEGKDIESLYRRAEKDSDKIANFDEIKSKYEELIHLQKQWEAGGKDVTSPEVLAITRLREELKGLIGDERVETEAARRNLLQSTLTTTNSAAKVLDDYKHVLKGHNEASKQAYTYLKNQKDALDDVRKKYDDGTASAEDLRKAQDEVRTATKNATLTFKENGEHAKSLFGRLQGLAGKFVSWLGVSQVIMYAVRAIKKMISASIEIEAAMTQLKIVTNATDSEMKQFSNTAITLAKNLGKSVIELTKSIETFSRLGYSLKDASELAKYATIMSNVAGVGNDEATTGITSIVKGFNLNVSDAEHVADVLVDVGQKYAVSAGELMEAYEKSGAALSATNTSLEKSAGLIAAANASVQDASVVGTALKTVSARIRGKNFCASVYSNIHAQARQAA